MNVIQKSNLARTAIYLLTQTPPPKFNMRWYADGPSYSEGTDFDYIPKPSQLLECGTSCCFAGHGPLALPERYKIETWEKYVKRKFGLSSDTDTYWFLFGANWPNDKKQAAARAVTYLEEKHPTKWDNWDKFLVRLSIKQLIERLQPFVRSK